ncbi:hypothetical protein SeMB42_g01091 [Synchytrium endobioticum]|uniref:Cytochrome P450 n=1 Tax=Synchytrium endobioticum TaxID=286115 RepID=A0A507DJA3_9FUNG|nr:hypothetical protein SeLEV6574_g00245 [Synchytrium endobioticum]TPX52961.1 hypothetical protein SeMB42_g01091 [Synchytrium endobioticum]
MKQLSYHTAIALGGAAVLLLVYLARRRRNDEAIPSDRLFPYPLGNFPAILSYSSRQAMHEYFLHLGRKYGKIARFVLADREYVILNDAAEAKRILTSPEWDKSEYQLKQLSGLNEASLLALKGAEHRRHRKLLQPTLGPPHLRMAVDATVVAMQELLAQWPAVGSAEVGFLSNMTAVTMDVISAISFGQKIGMVTALKTGGEFPFLKDMLRANEIQNDRTSNPEFLWPILGLAAEQARSQITNLRAFLSKIIHEKRKALDLAGCNRSLRIDAGKVSADKKFELTSKWDVLDRLLMRSEESPREKLFTENELQDTVMMFFQGGTDTTALTLTNLILQLSQRPDVTLKLQEELDSMLGKDGLPTYENLFQFKYLDWVIKEIMRLDPVAIGVQSRSPLADTTLCGYPVTPKHNVTVNTIALHLSPDYWADPELFIPERWADGFVPIPGSYLPFGDGAANCLGQRLANIEARVVAIMLLQKYNFELVEGQSITKVTRLLTGYKNDVKVRVMLREIPAEHYVIAT